MAADAITLTRQIAHAPAMAKFHPQELYPGIQYRTPQELEYAAGLIGTTIFHPAGTAKMGNSRDPLAVVSPRQDQERQDRA